MLVETASRRLDFEREQNDSNQALLIETASRRLDFEQSRDGSATGQLTFITDQEI